MLGWTLFLVSLSAGLISSYTTRVASRDVAGTISMQSRPAPRLVIGALNLPAVLAVLAWGFVYLPWYGVIASFVGVSLLVVPVAFGGRDAQARLPVLLEAQPFLDALLLSLAIALWAVL